jgi:hypothetical protein
MLSNPVPALPADNALLTPAYVQRILIALGNDSKVVTFRQIPV